MVIYQLRLALMILLPLAGTQLMRADERFLARVSVYAVDAFGTPLQTAPHIIGFKDSEQKEWSTAFKQGVAIRIPWGVYDITATGETWQTIFSERLNVDAPEVRITAAFSLSNPEVGGFPTTRLTGRVVGISRSGEKTWCKLSNIYSRAEYEIDAEQSNSFDFGDVNVGVYVVICGAGTDIRILEPLHVSGGMKPITLRASSISEPKPK